MRQVKIPGVEVFVEPVKEHRFVVVFRGDGLGDKVNDTDPQAVGVAPLDGGRGRRRRREKTAAIVNEFVAQVGTHPEGRCPDERLHAARVRPLSEDRDDAGGLRPEGGGHRRLPDVPRAGPAGRHGHAGRGRHARIAGRDAAKRVWSQYDFFFLHYKYTDSTGEDGNFAKKVEMIEKLDAAIPGMLSAEAGRVHRDRRPQHAEQDEVALVAPGADADPGRDWPGRTA